MKKSNILLYTAGAYGHFISWCYDYFSKNNMSENVPLNDLGNCHNHHYQPHNFYFPPNFTEYTNSSDDLFELIAIHENSIDYNDQTDIFNGKLKDVVFKNLLYLQENYEKIIYIYASSESMHWITNNQFFKIRISDWFGMESEHKVIEILKSYNAYDSLINELNVYGIDRIKAQINNHHSLSENIKMWGHQNIYDFELWELREFSSKYFYDRILNSIQIDDSVEQQLKDRFPNIKFIKLNSLKDNFKNTIQDILTFYEVKITNWDKIDNIYKQWLSKQFYIDSDSKIQNVVQAILNKTTLDWSDWNLTFIDEFCIQRLLADNGFEIKCWNLNTFPTNTEDFLPLIEKIH